MSTFCPPPHTLLFRSLCPSWALAATLRSHSAPPPPTPSPVLAPEVCVPGRLMPPPGHTATQQPPCLQEWVPGPQRRSGGRATPSISEPRPAGACPATQPSPPGPVRVAPRAASSRPPRGRWFWLAVCPAAAEAVALGEEAGRWQHCTRHPETAACSLTGPRSGPLGGTGFSRLFPHPWRLGVVGLCAVGLGLPVLGTEGQHSPWLASLPVQETQGQHRRLWGGADSSHGPSAPRSAAGVLSYTATAVFFREGQARPPVTTPLDSTVPPALPGGSLSGARVLPFHSGAGVPDACPPNAWHFPAT